MVVFLLPAFCSIQSETVKSVTIATLFMISPLMMTVTSIPQFSRANIAVNNLYQMENRLADILRDTNSRGVQRDFSGFQKISFKKLLFQYPPEDKQETPYAVGEIDLAINKGEILYIVGGNGSGKTTLLKLITGLYSPHAGDILIDGRKVTSTSLQAYRHLFTGIFADYHLFDKLYGLDEIPNKVIDDLIIQMELEEKTSYEDGRFSTTQLSQGQRKRLGMIVSLLEDKQIYLFDEWAADQDPHFKEYFYKKLLQELKAKGKTVIVISHDDRYFDFANRIIVMENGKIIEERFPKSPRS